MDTKVLICVKSESEKLRVLDKVKSLDVNMLDRVSIVVVENMNVHAAAVCQVLEIIELAKMSDQTSCKRPVEPSAYRRKKWERKYKYHK